MNRQQFLRLMMMSKKIDTTQEWWEEYGIRAEYIEGNGTQYIDLDIKGDNTTNFGLTFALTDLRQQQIAGSRETYNRNNITVVYPTNDVTNYLNIDFQNNENNRLATSTPLIVDEFYTAISGIDGIVLDDLIQPVVDITPFETITTLKLFATDGIGYTSQKMIGKIKNAFIEKNGFNAKYIPIQVKKQFTDRNNITHNIGDWIMVNSLLYKDVPTHFGKFTGNIKIENKYYFRSTSEQNPYYDLGRRIAYGKRIVIPISFEEATLNDIILHGVFGSRQGNIQDTAYNSFIGRNDLPMPKEVDKSLIPNDKKFTLTFENGKGYIDDVLMTEDTTPVTEYNLNTLLYNVNTIHVYNGAMNTYRLPIGTRVYGCQIYDVETSVLENNYQPQLDQTLKCTITGEVLPKLGINVTDSWDVIDVEGYSGYYEELDNIISDGINYIDTKVPLQNDLRWEIECAFKDTDGVYYPFGFLVAGQGRSAPVAIDSSQYGANFGYVNDVSFMPKPYGNRDTNYHKFIFNNIEDDSISMDGNIVDTHISQPSYYNETNSAYIFARYFGGAQNIAPLKLRKCKIWNKDKTLLRDYIPVKLLKDHSEHFVGEIGLWDKVNNVFYGSETVTPFTTEIAHLSYSDNSTSPYTTIGTWGTIGKVELDFSSTNTSNTDILLGRSYLNGYVGYVGTNDIYVREQAQPTAVVPSITNIEKGDGTRRVLTFNIGSTNTGEVTIGSYSDNRYSKFKKIYGFKVWDKEGSLVIDAVPREYLTGGNFYNKVTGEFLPINGSPYVLGIEQ